MPEKIYEQNIMLLGSIYNTYSKQINNISKRLSCSSFLFEKFERSPACRKKY